MEDGSGLAVVFNGTMMLFRGAGILTFKLIQFLTKLYLSKQVEERLSKSQYDSIMQFTKDTQGDYSIANIPTQDPEKVRQFSDALRKAGVAHCELPDLDLNDGMVQIAVKNSDHGKFMYVYEQFAAGQLAGGKKSLAELKSNTAGNYTIKSMGIGDDLAKAEDMVRKTRELAAQCGPDGPAMPVFLKGGTTADSQQAVDALIFDPKADPALADYLTKIRENERIKPELRAKAEDLLNILSEKPYGNLQTLCRCMNEYHVSYALLPDLNHFDHKTQIAIANVHTSYFNDALKAFQAHLGAETIPTSADLSPEEYIRTGQLSPNDYMRRTDDQVGAIKIVPQEDKSLAKKSFEESVKKEGDTFRYRELVEHAAKSKGDVQELILSEDDLVWHMKTDPPEWYAHIPGMEGFIRVDHSAPHPELPGFRSCFIRKSETYPMFREVMAMTASPVRFPDHRVAPGEVVVKNFIENVRKSMGEQAARPAAGTSSKSPEKKPAEKTPAPEKRAEAKVPSMPKAPR